MIKKITLSLVMLVLVNVYSQEKKEGDRAGVIFYSTVDRSDDFYDITVELFELGKVKFIETELFNEDEEKLTSKLYKLVYRDKKYFLSAEEDQLEKEVSIYDMSFKLENPDNNLNYPKVKVKVLNSEYNLIDFSQKIFY